MAQTVLVLGALLALVLVFFGTPVITAARDLDVPRRPSEKDRCPVCGMLVSPYLDSIGQVRHGDGTTVFFDGCKDLFKYLLSLDRYAPDRKRRSVAAVFVTNYYDGEIITARTAFYVAGGNVMGPLGPELVAHRSREAAEGFMKDHDGRRVLRFDEISEAVLQELQ
jgi:copper chaperone NosL